MTDIEAEGSQKAAIENESIPLWRALAQFTSDDLDTGLKTNAKVINGIIEGPKRNYNIHSFISVGSGALFCVSFLVLVVTALAGGEANYVFFSIAVFSMIIAIGPRVWRHFYQYGGNWRLIYQYGGRPDAPLSLPHDSDQFFEEFLSTLQSEAGPRAYYVQRFGDTRKYLARREFFGKLRYLLFSEHPEDRRLVMRFRTGRALPSDIFIDRHDLDRMRQVRNTKPKDPVGTKSKYPYEDAIVAVLGSAEVKAINLSKRDTALNSLCEMIVAHFLEYPLEDGAKPRTDYKRVKESAEKIYTVLKNFSD